MTTGQRIKAARKKAGMTQKELGRRIGISFQGVAQWENDFRNPKYETLKRIAAALGTTAEELMDVTFEEAPPIAKTELTNGESAPENRRQAIEKGIFALLGELYHSVNTKTIYDRDGYGVWDYFVIGTPPKTFVLQRSDIEYLTNWAMDTLKAAMPALVSQIMDTRPEDEIVADYWEGQS